MGIVCTGLIKKYGRREVVRGVSLKTFIPERLSGY